jgi:hypothetical protein
MQRDAMNALRLLQAEMLPGRPAVERLVDPLPTETELRGFPSPVPTQTISGLA